MSGKLGSRIIDGDGHIMEDNAGIIAHMQGTYREIAARKGVCFPPLDHLHSGRAVETPPQRDQRPPVGPQGWLEFLDDVGIDWTVMYPTLALSYGKIVSRDYAVAVCKAYNDWLTETYIEFNSRFKGMAIIPMQDPEEAAKELRRAVTELGLLGAMMPSNGLAQPLGAKQFWPIYEEANRLGCCLAVHGGAHDRFGMDHMNMYVPVHALGHPWGLTINCADILYNGIFERFPRVRIAFLEGGISWVPAHVERMDDHFENPRYGARDLISHAPSEYLKSGRIFFGCEGNEPFLGRVVEEVGEDLFLFSSDYPHADRTEGTAKFLRHRADIPVAVREKLLEDNARRFYGL